MQASARFSVPVFLAMVVVGCVPASIEKRLAALTEAPCGRDTLEGDFWMEENLAFFGDSIADEREPVFLAGDVEPSLDSYRQAVLYYPMFVIPGVNLDDFRQLARQCEIRVPEFFHLRPNGKTFKVWAMLDTIRAERLEVHVPTANSDGTSYRVAYRLVRMQLAVIYLGVIDMWVRPRRDYLPFAVPDAYVKIATNLFFVEDVMWVDGARE